MGVLFRLLPFLGRFVLKEAAPVAERASMGFLSKLFLGLAGGEAVDQIMNHGDATRHLVAKGTEITGSAMLDTLKGVATGAFEFVADQAQRNPLAAAASLIAGYSLRESGGLGMAFGAAATFAGVEMMQNRLAGPAQAAPTPT